MKRACVSTPSILSPRTQGIRLKNSSRKPKLSLTAYERLLLITTKIEVRRALRDNAPAVPTKGGRPPK